MGKVHCEQCKKSCKGQAIRLQDKYFHVKCFKCKECKKQLGSGGFYPRDDNYYCGEDYQRLFGTKCAACGKYVEGEVVTALGNTYHQTCFHCTKCNTRFGPGDKVTFTGKDYLCNNCLETASSVVATPLLGEGDAPIHVTAASPSKNSAQPPVATSTPARPAARGTLSSPLSDMSDILTDKENLANGSARGMLPSPHSTTSGYKSDADSEHTEKQERLSPIQNIMQYRSVSPSQSMASRKSRDSTLSHGSRHEVDYGKFFNTSYLEKPMGVAKGPSINPTERKPTHYHRPENFSYTQVRTDFVRPMKKETSSMMSALGDATKVTKKRLEDFLEEPMKNKEVIDLSKFPDSHRREENELLPIEREDWPAPAAAAAAYPELLYKHTKSARRSRGESSEIDSTDGTVNSSVDIDMEDDDVREVDPRIQKDIDHLSRLQSESGAAKVILEDLKRKAAEPPPLIDIISASRTPSASKEPVFRTRYESHVFASPSRDLDYQPQTQYALDDQILSRKYRNALQSVGNYPAMKPGYTLRAPRTAHMPSTFASARANGYFSDIEQCVTRDSDFDDVIERRSHKTPSIHTSQSSIEEYDPHTGLRRGGKLRGSSLSTDYSKTPFRKSISSVLNKDEPPKIYKYEELKLSNEVLPPGTDINWLEVHLEDSEFQSIFHMSRAEFYRLAEWKRNDIKKRVLLF